MKVLFRFDASEALRRKVAGLGVEVCPESDDAAYEGLLPGRSHGELRRLKAGMELHNRVA